MTSVGYIKEVHNNVLNPEKAGKQRSLLMMMRSDQYKTKCASKSSAKLVRAVSTYKGLANNKLLSGFTFIERLRSKVEAKHWGFLAKLKTLQRFNRQVVASKYFERCIIAAKINHVVLTKKHSKLNINFSPNADLTKRFLSAVMVPYNEYKDSCVLKQKIHQLKVVLL